MIRADLWRLMGGFDEDFPHAVMEDVAFRERLRDSGERIKFVPAAVVDHPPRRVPSAEWRIRVHEAHLLYYYKYVGKSPSLASYLTEFASYSLRPIIRAGLSWDAAVALGSRVLEASFIVKNWSSWNRRFGELAKRPPILRAQRF